MKNRIKERITESGMTMKDVATRLGMSNVGLSQIANSESPKFETFAKVADILGVPAWYLYLSDEDIADVRGNNNNSRRERPEGQFYCPVCHSALCVSVGFEHPALRD